MSGGRLDLLGWRFVYISNWRGPTGWKRSGFCLVYQNRCIFLFILTEAKGKKQDKEGGWKSAFLSWVCQYIHIFLRSQLALSSYMLSSHPQALANMSHVGNGRG